MGNWNPMDIITSPINAITNSIGLGSLSDVFGGITGQSALQLSDEQFNRSLDWEKEKFSKNIELANTAHEREIADLKKAGLNPILSANAGNGASSNIGGAGVAPTAHLDFSGLTNILTSIIPAMAQMKNANSAQIVAESDSFLKTAEALKSLTDRDIAKLDKWFKEEDKKIYGEIQRGNLSKSPYGVVKMVESFIKSGSSSLTGQKSFDLGKKLSTVENTIKGTGIDKLVDSLTIPGKLKREFGTLLKILRLFMSDDSMTIRDSLDGL